MIPAAVIATLIGAALAAVGFFLRYILNNIQRQIDDNKEALEELRQKLDSVNENKNSINCRLEELKELLLEDKK